MADVAAFNTAAERAKSLSTAPSNETLLWVWAPSHSWKRRIPPSHPGGPLLRSELYALYKQATVGDVNTDRPGFMDFKGRAKWDVRASLRAARSPRPNLTVATPTPTAGVGEEKGHHKGGRDGRIHCAGGHPLV